MTDLLADTHSVIWYLFDPGRLSPAAKAALLATETSGRIFISTISLVEINYLSSKFTFPYSGVLPALLSLIADPNQPVKDLPLNLDVVRALDQVPRAEIPDMPDRIVAATAIAYRLPLVSVDADIQGSTSLKSAVAVIW